MRFCSCALRFASVSLLALATGGCIRVGDTVSAGSGGNDASAGVDPPATGDGQASDPTQNPAEPADDATTSRVAQVYCEQVIAVGDLPSAGQTALFQLTAASGSFAGWSIGDGVAFDAATGRLTNSDRALQAAVTFLGTPVRTARIVTYSTGHSVITLDDSSFWITNTADRPEALDWQASDDVIVVQPTSDSEWWLVNIDRCEAIQATSSS